MPPPPPPMGMRTDPTQQKKAKGSRRWVKRLLTSYREMMQSTAGFRRGQCECVGVPISGEEMMFLRINSCETTSLL